MFKINDILIYNKPKKKFFGKRISDEYIVSYIGQGEIEMQYELKTGNIFKIIDICGGISIVKPLNFSVPKHTNYLCKSCSSYIFTNNFSIVSKKEFNNLIQKIRENKLKRIV